VCPSSRDNGMVIKGADNSDKLPSVAGKCMSST
jgi:hypothetical protein